MKSLSRVQLFATLWTVAHQAALSMGFSSQEYWSGLPFPSPKDLPNPRIEPGSPALQADALSSEPPGKPTFMINCKKNLFGWAKKVYILISNQSEKFQTCESGQHILNILKQKRTFSWTRMGLLSILSNIKGGKNKDVINGIS